MMHIRLELTAINGNVNCLKCGHCFTLNIPIPKYCPACLTKLWCLEK